MPECQKTSKLHSLCYFMITDCIYIIHMYRYTYTYILYILYIYIYIYTYIDIYTVHLGKTLYIQGFLSLSLSISLSLPLSLYIYIKYIQGFSYWRKWGESPPHQLKICSFPHLEKFPPSRLRPPPNFYCSSVVTEGCF